MSKTGRHIIDRIKRMVEPRFSLPVPPYGKPEFWENVYGRMGSTDVFEWGGCSFSDFATYDYTLIHHPLLGTAEATTTKGTTTTTTTLEETLLPELSPHDDDRVGKTAHSSNNSNRMGASDVQQPPQQQEKTTATTTETRRRKRREGILLLGCGNSKFGEDMIDYGGRFTQDQYSLLQLDVSHRVLDGLAQRCKQYIERGDMALMQEDVTTLSSLKKAKIQAVAAMDKGLIDALFCASEYEQIRSMVQSVHEILRPGGIFCFLSFSRPEFLLDKFLQSSSSSLSSFDKHQQHQQQSLHSTTASTVSSWHDIQIRELDRILLYRFQKSLTTNHNFLNQPTRPSKKVTRKP